MLPLLLAVGDAEIGHTVNFIVAVFVVISSVYPQSFGVTEGSAYANLALTYAVQVSLNQKVSVKQPFLFQLYDT